MKKYDLILPPVEAGSVAFRLVIPQQTKGDIDEYLDKFDKTIIIKKV